MPPGRLDRRYRLIRRYICDNHCLQPTQINSRQPGTGDSAVIRYPAIGGFALGELGFRAENNRQTCIPDSLYLDCDCVTGGVYGCLLYFTEGREYDLFS